MRPISSRATLLYYMICFCARVALDDMGLIGGTLLYYIVCFCDRVALDGVIFSWIIKGHKGQFIKYDRISLLAETKRRATSPLTYFIGN
jgi:hypothetical protein